MSIQVTGDGTHTIHSETFDVPYHSVHGALQETNHVFINAGLLKSKEHSSKIKILELGFGTGLNVLATIVAGQSHNLSIDFHTIEAYPISMDDAKSLNYVNHLDGISQELLDNLHEAPWGESIAVAPQFSLTKHLVKMEDFESKNLFDLVYFDAFAPTAQPELWEPSFLSKLYDLMRDNGILVTYCAKGQFKRDLRAVGFEVQALPGPPGKREMTRAIKLPVE